MLHNQALRDDMMRGHAADHRGRDRPDGRRLGRRGRDRPARLVRRADDLHVVGVPDRQAVPRGARRALRRSYYHDLERAPTRIAYVDPYADIESLPRAATRPASSWSSWCRGSSTSAGRAGTVAARGRATCSTCSCRSTGRADYITGMFISMMFAGHHTTSGTAAWTLIELLRHPDVMAEVVAELDDLYADGAEVSLPGAARDPAAGGGAQGDAAAAPAADPPAARRRRRRSSWPATASRPGTMVGGLAGGVEPDRRGLPRAGARSTRAATSTRARRTCRTLDLDPVRRRPAPLRRRRLRDDAAQGDLLGAPARLRVRAGPAARDLPRRPLQDGHPARPAVPGDATGGGPAERRAARPSAAGDRTRRCAAARAGDSAIELAVVVDLDLCQGHQVCEGEAPDVFGFDEDADRSPCSRSTPTSPCGRRSRRPSSTAQPWPDDRGGTRVSMPHHPCRDRGDLGALARGQPRRRGGRRLAADGRLVRRGRDLRLDVRARRALHGRRPRRDPRLRPRPRDGRPRRLALRLPGARDRREEGHGASASGSSGPAITDDATGKEYEILGIGGSLVRRRARGPTASCKFAWQRDWFDLGVDRAHVPGDRRVRQGAATRCSTG